MNPKTCTCILYSLSLIALGATILLPPSASILARNQENRVDRIDRERGHAMIDTIKRDLKKHYYDATFRGLDLDKRFKEADAKIDQATSVGQIFGIVAQAVLDLDDSHTFLIPPRRATRTDYGWQMQMVGDKCYVAAVKPGSDAEAKGLKVGDEVYSIDGLWPTRENMWKLRYLYYTLRPRPGMKLVIESPGNSRELVVLAKVSDFKRHFEFTGADIGQLIREEENEARLLRQRFVEFGTELIIWKMPQFSLEPSEVDDVMDKVRKHKALILDLRGNPGGYVVTLQRLIGNFFDHDLKIGELTSRKETKPMIAKTKGGDRVFKGELVVLVDSDSASSSEVFARVVQLEKRGVVIGDRTAGAVMVSQTETHELGVDRVVPYAVNITRFDHRMPDGKSLERTGVTPDELLLPTSKDLAERRDPALVRAAERVGVKIASEKAGSYFPIEWKK